MTFAQALLDTNIVSAYRRSESKVVAQADEIVVRAADIYGDLYRRGVLIGDADTLIAATALVNGLVVVTNNEKHFNRVSGLQIENWLN